MPFPPYPADLIPRSRRRRGGFSIGRFIYFGSHPVLLLIGLAVNSCLLALGLAWLLLVTIIWLLCCAGAGVGWLVALPFRAAKAAPGARPPY